MGLGTAVGIAIGFNRGGSQRWESYWANQPEVLFFGLYSEISGGQMPNKVTGSSDFLTVAGVPGSETYQCPNTAPYIAADTDYIWFKTDASQRTVTTAELIGYDLQRTPVKYEDDSPNEIVAIIILNAAVVGTKRDNLFRDMWLPILWDNNLNGYGHIKDNRLGQQLWTPESVYDAASVALFARMAAAGEAQTDDRKTAIDTAIVALKAAGLFDTKFEAFYLTRGKGEASTKMNWIKDAYNLTKIFAGTLTYAEDVGYHTDGNCLISTNYKPSTITGLYELDNASFGFKVGGTLTANKGHGTISNAPIRGTLFVVTSNRVNSSDSGGSAYELGYNCVARTNATGFKQYKNAATADVTAASSAKCDTLAFMGLYNEQANSQTYTTATEILEFGFLGAYITQAEFLTIQGIINTYIAAL